MKRATFVSTMYDIFNGKKFSTREISHAGHEEYVALVASVSFKKNLHAFFDKRKIKGVKFV